MRGIHSKSSMIVFAVILVALAGSLTASAQTVRLIEILNDPWKYHTNNVDPLYDPADAWIAPSFPDDSWPTGTGLFGRESQVPPGDFQYTNVDVQCSIAAGRPCVFTTFILNPAAGGPPSTYFRKHFTFN